VLRDQFLVQTVGGPCAIGLYVSQISLRGVKEVVERLAAAREARRAGRNGDPCQSAPPGHRPFDRADYPCQDPALVLSPDIRSETREASLAKVSEHVLAAEDGECLEGHSAQHVLGFCISELKPDLRKVSDLEAKEGEALTPSPGAGQGRGAALIKAGAIRQPGERILQPRRQPLVRIPGALRLPSRPEGQGTGEDRREHPCHGRCPRRGSKSQGSHGKCGADRREGRGQAEASRLPCVPAALPT